MKVHELPQQHKAFGPELGLALGNDGLLPSDSAVIQVVKHTTGAAVLMALALLSLLISVRYQGRNGDFFYFLFIFAALAAMYNGWELMRCLADRNLNRVPRHVASNARKRTFD